MRVNLFVYVIVNAFLTTYHWGDITVKGRTSVMTPRVVWENLPWLMNAPVSELHTAEKCEEVTALDFSSSLKSLGCPSPPQRCFPVRCDGFYRKRLSSPATPERRQAGRARPR